MSTTDLAVFTNLPDHVLNRVFELYLHMDDLLTDELEAMDTQRGTRFATRYQDFVQSFLRACKRFYLLAVKLVWRSVIVRSSDHFEVVAKQAQAGVYLAESQNLPTLIQRLEIRVCGTYNASKLCDFITNACSLSVLVIGDGSANAMPGSFCPSIDPVILRLSSIESTVRRIHFLSDFARPSPTHVASILATNPNLRTLAVAHLDNTNFGIMPLHGSSTTPIPLTTLSLGTPLWGLPIQNNNPFEFLLSALLSSSLTLPNLRELEIFEVTPSFLHLLRRYGNQLRRLLYAAAFVPNGPLTHHHWVDLCPNLDRLDWIITRSQSERPPIQHTNLTKIKVEYVKEMFENPWETLNFVEDILDHIHYSVLPRLRKIEVVVRGENLPHFDDFDWLGTDEEMESVALLENGNGWTVTISPRPLVLH